MTIMTIPQKQLLTLLLLAVTVITTAVILPTTLVFAADTPSTSNSNSNPDEPLSDVTKEQQPAESEPAQSAEDTQAPDTDNSISTEPENKNVARAQFTTAIVDREPTDDIVTLSNNAEKIYFFTELINLKGVTITHRWEYKGETMAEVNFLINGDRWRIYSSKSLKPELTGRWSVTVLDDQGTTLKTSHIDVVKADNVN